MPLAGAVFRSNERMVIRVYEAYQQLSRENLEHQDKGLNGWDVQKVSLGSGLVLFVERMFNVFWHSFLISVHITLMQWPR